VPIKVEDEEEELVDYLVGDRKARVPSDKDPKPPTAVKKASRFAESSRMRNAALPLHMDDDVTPPASGPLPKRRKSGIDHDYIEPDEDAGDRRRRGDANVKHRPPPRRKSIRDLRDSDFEYREHEEEAGEESDADELNLGHGAHQGRPAKQQRANQKTSLPNRRKRKVVEAMDVDEPVVSGRGAGKVVKTR